jgi:predicted nucleotidyltransferase
MQNAQTSVVRREALSELFNKYRAKIGYLFGSQKDAGADYLSGQSAEIEKGSDLDIGVVFEELPRKVFSTYGELYAGLSILFEPFNVDLVFLQETDALFQYGAILGNRIYCENETFCDDFEEMVMKRASDLSYKKNDFERDFLEAVRDGYFEIKYR